MLVVVKMWERGPVGEMDCMVLELVGLADRVVKNSGIES